MGLEVGQLDYLRKIGVHQALADEFWRTTDLHASPDDVTIAEITKLDEEHEGLLKIGLRASVIRGTIENGYVHPFEHRIHPYNTLPLVSVEQVAIVHQYAGNHDYETNVRTDGVISYRVSP